MLVRITGWKEGLQKISLNRLLLEYNKKFTLSSAKQAVDDILENKPIEFDLIDSLVNEFTIRAAEIGVIVEIRQST